MVRPLEISTHRNQRTGAYRIAAILWGNQWQGQAVIFKCDNQSVVYCIESHTCKDPLVMQLLRCLFMLAGCYDFYPLSTHIARSLNGPADALSHNILPSFHLQAPHANSRPVTIPPQVAALFQQPSVDWISPSWRALHGFLADGTAESTGRVYRTGQKRYFNFCQLSKSQAFPVTELQLMRFATYLAQEGLSWQTIKSYLSGIRHYLLVHNLHSPFSEQHLP